MKYPTLKITIEKTEETIRREEEMDNYERRMMNRSMPPLEIKTHETETIFEQTIDSTVDIAKIQRDIIKIINAIRL